MKLRRARDAVASDLNGKYAAYDIDGQALGLNEHSTGLSYIRFTYIKNTSILVR